MPKIQYKEINFRGKSLELINLVNQVINEYKNQGYELTLRQTYYQLVARGYIPNNERSYKNIGNLINDGRLAGLIDWHSIVDRTRNLRGNGHWDKPEDVIASARYSYLLNKWDGQPNYVEVWVEKDALVDIVGQACIPLDTPYFSCRGYTSQSEMWSAAQRFIDQSYRDNRSFPATNRLLFVFKNFETDEEFNFGASPGSYMTSLVNNTANNQGELSVSGGTVTYNPGSNSFAGLASGATYNWIAVGQ